MVAGNWENSGKRNQKDGPLQVSTEVPSENGPRPLLPAAALFGIGSVSSVLLISDVRGACLSNFVKCHQIITQSHYDGDLRKSLLINKHFKECMFFSSNHFGYQIENNILTIYVNVHNHKIN